MLWPLPRDVEAGTALAWLVLRLGFGYMCSAWPQGSWLIWVAGLGVCVLPRTGSQGQLGGLFRTLHILD